MLAYWVGLAPEFPKIIPRQALRPLHPVSLDISLTLEASVLRLVRERPPTSSLPRQGLSRSPPAPSLTTSSWG